MLPTDSSIIMKFFIFCLIIDLSHQVALRGDKVRDAKTEEFASVVSIGTKSSHRKNTHFCTGTLISEKHVLTAGHCLKNKLKKLYPDGVVITAGSIDIKQGQKYYPSHWKTYSEWECPSNEECLSKYETIVHDIAIITLNSSVPNIQPAILADRENVNKTLKVAGWGYTNNDEKPTILKTALLNVISNEECNDELATLTNRVTSINEYTLCGKADPSVLTDCGDSGGPSFTEDDRLVGVMIGRCPLREYPIYPLGVSEQTKITLLSNVSSYRKFIDSVTKNP